ncbi:hypothetical protein K431DRAFT_263496 [Polychaeton citri CBS 116435]|uniref:SNF7 family protein n=1 Tax=Polychaeton citri CBS 116435 TaxID=1314669 RepID=A0A9P4URD0_9PEZI|nr:hypothetical protein K431DRAFT_263496 [Polychaeton citri CBS 116435]
MSTPRDKSLFDFLGSLDEAFRSRARIASLYSDFSTQKSTNPEGYAANTQSWFRVLNGAFKKGFLPKQQEADNCLFVFRANESIPIQFESDDFGQPLALASVIADALKDEKLMTLTDFFSRKDSIYARTHQSALPTPWQAVKWGLSLLGVGSSGREHDIMSFGDVVIIENVEGIGRAILEKASKLATSNISRIFSVESFVTTFAHATGRDNLMPMECNILLQHLARDRNALSYDSESKTIKFKSPTASRPEPVTEEDKNIASLRTLISQNLQPQVSNLERYIATLNQTARTAVANKQLTSARAALKSKKLAEATLEKRQATLMQLEEVYTKIEAAADNVEIVRVMESSSKTLASLNKQTGGAEHVQDVVYGLREQMAEVDEYHHVLVEGNEEAVNEDEVADELEALEKAEKEKEEAEKRKADEERVEKEAEETRKKLAVLDQVGERGKAQEVEEKVKEGQQERKVAEAA